MSGLRSSGDLAADRRYLWAEASAAEGDHAGAADLLRQALDLAPGWAAGWFALGQALAALGQAQPAIEAFATCLALAPEDTFGAGLRQAQLAGGPAPSGMPPRYVAQLFDDYAARFDDHLTRALNYRGPEIVLAALDAAGQILPRPQAFPQEFSQEFPQVLDLGCGTGLMAVALGARAGRVDGVDLSRAMLAQAQATGRYRSLAEADVVAFLEAAMVNARPDLPAYDLIVAADVFVYLGDLAPVLALAAQCLAAEGRMAFTVQHHQGSGFVLGADLRFAHAPAYLADVAAAAGLAVLIDQPVVTRQDAGRDVPGRVMVLARKG